METNFPKLEQQVLERWRELGAFEESLKRRKKAPRFVFYEGPPTANGSPGIHHVEGRSFKDMVCRYKTMAGFLVERKGGWDTHGLPVELQVEKKLGLKSKKDIEKYGIAKFNKECKASVWNYKKEWDDLTKRIGFWLDLKNPYITYETPYIESLWWIIKQWWDKKLFYQDYKVVPFCTRCGTPLSSHEVAQGYKTVKEPAVYVKFKVKNPAFAKASAGRQNSKVQNIFQNVYFLAWTTTPWTLPGNVGLAVHPSADYIVAEKNGERYIVAKTRANAVLGEHKVLKTFKGKELVGIAYEPLFRFQEPAKGKKVWEVIPADFVSMEEGTGLVHTAVAYGAEDFELGKKENLAMLHLVNEEGKFIDKVSLWKGMFVKDADPLIIEELKKTGALFKEELYEHEYPFCWRCSTPLLYYAKTSWFVDMQKVKKQLLANNEKMNWLPSHIKRGRFGEWLKEVKDWAFSRERYWGTPLPIWECAECRHQECIGSLEEFRSKLKLNNTYYILRHGHSERQVYPIVSSWPESKPVPLTAQGIEEAKKAGRALAKKHIDSIYSSDLTRAKQTAEIAAKECGASVQFDRRLREFDAGDYNEKPVPEVAEFWHKDGETPVEHFMRRFEMRLPGGENWTDTQKRMVEFLKDMETRHKGKTILIVSHEVPLMLLVGTLKELSKEEIILKREKEKIETGTWAKLEGSLLPSNEDMDIDLHRPYIDEMKFSCPACKKGEMKRIPDVADVWFDSGAMPYAQWHWPFGQNQKSRLHQSFGGQAKIKNQTYGKLIGQIPFPADYIVEAIDQTRGWFYTLLATATLLGFKAPYKNVISYGHVLDEKGNKMSKSKGNVVNPWTMIDKYGADAVRWYFYTINQPWDSKLFAEKDLEQTVRKFLLTLWNSFVFYQTYLPERNSKIQNPKSKIHSKHQTKDTNKRHLLDRWLMSRLQGVKEEATKRLEKYDITAGARAIESFVVNDLSLWYIRRSRPRFQNPETSAEREEASGTLRQALEEVCLLSAPFIPFLSEYIYSQIAPDNKESVHWQDWPAAAKNLRDKKLETSMEQVRDIAAKALAERAKAGVKVRQPLQTLTLKGKKNTLTDEFARILKEEINVKTIAFDQKAKADLALDTAISEELRQEGQVRELLRTVQDMRKEAGYKPHHKILLRYSGDQSLRSLISRNAEYFRKTVGLHSMLEGDKPKEVFDLEREMTIDGKSLWIAVKKIA